MPPDDQQNSPGSDSDRILDLAGRPWLSAEVLPPDRPEPSLLLREAHALAAAGARLLFVPDAPGGHPRVDPVAAGKVVQAEAGVPAIPHLNCRDRNRTAIEGALLAAALSGLHGVKAVTGDPVPGGDAKEVYEISSVELVQLTCELATRTGVSLAPVVGHSLGGHREDLAIERLRRKLQAGARLVVMTPTLDPGAFADFRARAGQLGVPVVASVTLITGAEVLEYFRNEVLGFQIPEEDARRIREAATPEAALHAGVESALRLVRAVRRQVAGFHVVPPFGRAMAAVPLLQALHEELRRPAG